MEQTDWIAEQEKIKLSKELEYFIVKATAKNTSLMMTKIGGNITLSEHLIIQRTLQVAKSCLSVTESIKPETQEPLVIVGVKAKPQND
jgi:hypothetical protein